VSRGRRPLSIGARWALSSSCILLLGISAIALFVYLSLERRIERQADQLLSYYVAEVFDELERPGADARVVAASIVERLTALDPVLRPSIALFGPRGELLAAEGVLGTRSVPLPESTRSGSARQSRFEVDLGGNHPYLLAASASPGGFVEVAIHLREFRLQVRAIRQAFALALPLALLVAGASGWWLARRSLRPIAAITETAQHIRVEELGARIPTTGSGDELDRLADTLNEMLDRIRSSVEKVRQVSGDAAHQLRSPLALLQNRIEVTLETVSLEAAHRADLEALLEQILHISGGVNAMLQLARSESALDLGLVRAVDLAALLDSVIALFEPLASEAQIALHQGVCAPLQIQGDPASLGWLFGNLVDNAIRYTPAPGAVSVALERVGSEAVVRVADTGVGIPASELERIFDRFHRGQLGRGSPGWGIGLAVAREVARAHRGRIEVESRPGSGSVFSVHLPALG